MSISASMNELKAQKALDIAESVQKFINDATHDDEHRDGRSPTAALCIEVTSLFRQVLLQLNRCDSDTKSHAQHRSLERSFSRLKLWCGDYSVPEGGLDGILAGSRKLTRATQKPLASVGNTLVHRLIPLLYQEPSLANSSSLAPQIFIVRSLVEGIEDDVSDGSGSDSSSNFEYDTLEEIAEDLATDTTCLVALHPLLMSPIPETSVETLASIDGAIEWIPHQAHFDRISNRFPGAEASVLVWLGKANFERYIRCQRERADLTEQGHDPGGESLEKSGTIEVSQFHDSGLGSSVPSKSSYAETVMSYGGGEGHSVRIPPLPVEARKGKPFPCVACGKSVRITNNSAWKQHLYADLRPWMCLDESCIAETTLFDSRLDWISHLALEHEMDPQWQAFQCPLCCSDTGAGKFAITKHLGGHLEEISLGALPIGVDWESESDNSSVAGSSAKSADYIIHGEAVALFDYEPKSGDELPLTVGQTIWVTARYEQGWLVAENPTTQGIGLVMEGYVRLRRDAECEVFSHTDILADGSAPMGDASVSNKIERPQYDQTNQDKFSSQDSPGAGEPLPGDHFASSNTPPFLNTSPSSLAPPKWDRTMGDIYNDELYNPNFTITSAPSPSSPPPGLAESPSQNDLFTRTLKLANSQRLQHNTPSSVHSNISPFCHGSPLAPPEADLSRRDIQFRDDKGSSLFDKYMMPAFDRFRTKDTKTTAGSSQENMGMAAETTKLPPDPPRAHRRTGRPKVKTGCNNCK
ncbi:hypothetical protein BJ170DRAFT_638024 [Xylariales sp. AK1849]|nr:hypothetical protein BJ170DRAFT_638024 [Xylariales sp. AK1849]